MIARVQALLLSLLLLAALAISSARAETITTNNSVGGGGGGGGTVSISGGCGTANISPNPITGIGQLNNAILSSNIVTASSYTLQAADSCNVVVLQSGVTTVAVPTTTTTGFGAGNYWFIDNQSGGTITLTITSPSNLDGASSVSIVNATAFAFQSGSDANYHYVVKSAPGIGTVTSVTGGCGTFATPSSIVNSGSISSSTVPVIVTGANASLVTGYCGELVRLNNASNQIPTIVQAGSAGFAAGWYATICNIGAGTQTITPVTGTIGGLSSYLLSAGSPSVPICVGIVSDGTSDYNIVNAVAGTVTSVSAACGNTTGTGSITSAGTVTGQITTVTSTSAAYAVVASNCGGIVYLNNGTTPVPTIAEAGSTGFPAGWFTDLCNVGSAAQVLTPGGGTVGGASTKSIGTGSAASPTCIRIISDGTSNYTIR
jgi:hypothetical protein